MRKLLASWLRSLASLLDAEEVAENPFGSHSGRLCAPAELRDFATQHAATNGIYLPRKGGHIGAWIPGDLAGHEHEFGAYVRGHVGMYL